MSSSANVVFVTAVTLAGTVFTSAGSFCADTITVGSVIDGGVAPCANDVLASRASTTSTVGVIRANFNGINIWPLSLNTETGTGRRQTGIAPTVTVRPD